MRDSEHSVRGPASETLRAIGFMRTQMTILPGMSAAAGSQNVADGLGFAGALAGIEQVRAGYGSLVESILGGNRAAAESVSALFGSLTGGGKKAQEELAGSFEAMAGQIFAGMGDYAKRLGLLSGLAAKAFAALQSMNPFAAAAASVALIAIGQALKSLARGVGKGGSGQSGVSGSAYPGPATTATGAVAPGSHPVNIYINGCAHPAPMQ